MKDIFKQYVENRKAINSNSFMFYLKKILFPLFIIFPLLFLKFNYSVEIVHSSISSALVSVSAILVAFLVFSMTILLTKENTENIPNTNKKNVEILVSNTEVLTLFSSFSIFLNLIYMYISNLNNCPIENWKVILDVVSFLAIYLTVFIIKLAIDDLLFLSNTYSKTS